jgi:hypothetical protein
VAPGKVVGGEAHHMVGDDEVAEAGFDNGVLAVRASPGGRQRVRWS